jgi:hypothetical protein
MLWELGGTEAVGKGVAVMWHLFGVQCPCICMLGLGEQHIAGVALCCVCCTYHGSFKNMSGCTLPFQPAGPLILPILLLGCRQRHHSMAISFSRHPTCTRSHQLDAGHLSVVSPSLLDFRHNTCIAAVALAVPSWHLLKEALHKGVVVHKSKGLRTRWSRRARWGGLFWGNETKFCI